MFVLYIILGIAVGFAAAFLILRGEKEKLRDALSREKEQLRKSLTAEKEVLRETLSRENAALRDRLAKAGESLVAAQVECKDARELAKREREQHEAMQAQMKRHYDEAIEAVKSKFHEMATAELTKRAEELHKTNEEHLRNIVNPVREEMSRVEKAVQDAKVSSAEQKAQVEKAIEGLANRTLEIGKNAESLANALKDNGKVQGDWGELILQKILEESGLREGHEFSVQENIKDGEGHNLRPDVIVNCPGDKKVIVDSKVSLTAYFNYSKAETDEERKRYERENMLSVKKHVDELSAKSYEKLVGNTISHVLMFVPNEGSYILALRTDPQLGYYAFRKGVIIINPTNLMLALQLIYNLWQSERQSRNIEEIIKQSSDLYDKFCSFIDTFLKAEETIRNAQGSMEKARLQLCEGKGNIVRRLELLKEKGVTPKKSIPDSLLVDERTAIE